MAELTTLARPYARAVFEIAEAAKALAPWSEKLSTLAAVARDPRIASLLNSPVYTAEQLAQTLAEVCGDALDDAARALLKVLAYNKRLALLPWISSEFEALKAAREKAVEVEVISAFEMADDSAAQLGKALSAHLDREVHLHHSVDASLLGGALIRAGDTVIDGSVRGRLSRLAEAMNS